MRVVHRSSNEKIAMDDKGFSDFGRITQMVNRYRGAKLVFDMKNVKSFDGNLATVYAAMALSFQRSKNQFRILPRKACGTDVAIRRDLFGYSYGWERDMEETFRSGATGIFAFDRNDTDGFKDYLVNSVFRKDWKGIVPCHYKYQAKVFLMDLFKNACEHGRSDEPVIVSSAYDGDMLRITMVDCGQGFRRVFSKVIPEIENEGQAISWAMSGFSVKKDSNRSLKNLGDYCKENNGELLIVSGSASVLYDRDGFHKVVWLPGAFRGSIINFSIKIDLPEFLRQAA
ncbi:MAG: hypothetical protein ACKOE6_05930 [Flammeovirgaceae bacterium]